MCIKNMFKHITRIAYKQPPEKGDKGEDARSPYVGDNGNWFFYDDSKGEYVDSGRSATGDDGHSPYVGTNGNWFEYNAATGEYEDTGITAKGEKGDKGDKGDRGAQTRQIVWTAGIEFYSGADGEEYADFVYFNGLVYQCLKSHTSSSDETPYDSVENNTGYWRFVPSFENIATKVLLLGTDAEGWIMDGGVIKHTSGKIQLTSDGQISAGNKTFTVDKDGNMVATSGTFGNLTIGETATGYPCLRGSVWYDDTEEHYVELSPESFILGARVGGEEVDVFDIMPYFYADKYDRNYAFRLRMRPGTVFGIESGMIRGLRPEIQESSSETTTLGCPYSGPHPSLYILTALNPIITTLQTDGYQVGDTFTIINKRAVEVSIINNTQLDIYNALEELAYSSEATTITIPATTTRTFHMVWTDSGFILYK